MVLAEYWRLVEEEARSKERPKVGAGLERSGFSAEERELMEGDPELIEHLKKIRDDRAQRELGERAAQEQRAEEDLKIVAPIAEYERHRRLCKEWNAGWSALVEVEERQAIQFDQFLDRCWEKESAELDARSKIAEQRLDELKALYRLERQKCRYLQECTAWVEDWEEDYKTRWVEDRKARAEELSRPPPPDPDERFILMLEAEEKKQMEAEAEPKVKEQD
jgi:hypothetical protein